MNSIASFLLKVEPFSCLPPAEVERLALLAQVVHHVKGEVVYNEGEPSDSTWILQSGRGILFQYNSEGKPLAMDAVRNGELLSPLDHVKGERSTFLCTAVACVDSTSIRIPSRYVESLYGRYPAMVAGIYELCSRQMGRMRSRLLNLQEPVQQRIIRTLFELKQKGGNTLPYTKREISELASTTVETTIRVLSGFEKRRWVVSERGSLTLKDIPHLESLLEEITRHGSPVGAMAAA